MRYFLLAFLLCLTACDLFAAPAPPVPPAQPDPVLTVAASVPGGEAPLPVTFTATLEPATSQTFRWAVGTQAQAQTTATFSYTFDRPGLYVVSVAAAGLSASESVTVTAPPVVEPNPDDFALTQTPAGPAPWAVRYTVAPAGNGFTARCRERSAFGSVFGNTFACVHEPGDTVQVRSTDASGEVTATVEAVPEVVPNEGVAFAGEWRYSSRGKTETFTITEGSETAGSSADGRFELFTVGQRDGLIVEFTIDGRTVVLTPEPDDEGRQLYRGEVYGLTLEPLPAETPESRL